MRYYLNKRRGKKKTRKRVLTVEEYERYMRRLPRLAIMQKKRRKTAQKEAKAARRLSTLRSVLPKLQTLHRARQVPGGFRG